MFQFDPSSRILKVQQYAEPEIPIDLTGYQKASYQKFVNHTALKVLNELLLAMQKNYQDVSWTLYPAKLDDSDTRERVDGMFNRYWYITADIVAHGAQFPKVTILRIPDMDDNAILNVDAHRRVILMQMTAADGISYDTAARTIGLSVPLRNISITIKDSDATVKYGRKAIPMHDIVHIYIAREDPSIDVNTLFEQAFLKAAIATDGGAASEAIDSRYAADNIYETYHKPVYHLGDARDALNEAVSLRRAIGQTLSRDVGPFPAGTAFTEEAFRWTQQNFVNSIYIKAVPDAVGFKLCQTFNVPDIPRGTPINDFLRSFMPEDCPFLRAYTLPKNLHFVPYTPPAETDQDYYIQGAAPYYKYDERLSSDMLELLYNLNYEELCVAKSGNRVITVRFEEEVISNYMVRLVDASPDGVISDSTRYADEWVYYANNPTLEPRDTNYLTVWDWIALYSLAGWIRRHPELNTLQDKDSGLLKSIQGPNELMAIALSNAITKFYAKNGRGIRGAFESNSPNSLSFYGLTKDWLSEMRDLKYLVPANIMNPIASITQANQIISSVAGSEIPDKMRLLSMGYYGRICPYETPNGPKLGVTNAKAVGARIRPNGTLETPYRSVGKEFDASGRVCSCYISDNIVYMSAQEEVQYRIGDVLSLDMIGNTGRFANTKIVARVRDADGTHTVETVDAWSIDYVNAYACQHLSPSASLIPFVGADDSARVTYASGMLKQSILLQNNEVPRVMTSMYRRMLSNNPQYFMKMPWNGVVYELSSARITLVRIPDDIWPSCRHEADADEWARIHGMDMQLGMEWERIELPVHPTTISGNSVNFLDYKVKQGDFVAEGTILWDCSVAPRGIYSPGTNMLTVFIPDGYNYEDAIEISEAAAQRMTSITVETVSEQYPKLKDEMTHPDNTMELRYIPEDSVISNIVFTQGANPVQKDRYLRSGMSSGLLIGIERENEPTAATYRAYLLAFNRLRTGDKMVGRHANKGTASIVQKNSMMPRFCNGRPADLVLNPCGVPSRLNIGQLFEGYLGFVAMLLDIHIETDCFNGASRNDVKLLMQYVYDLANEPNAEGVFERYSMLPASLHAQARFRLDSLRQWAGAFNPNGTAYMYNPRSGRNFATAVPFGVPYILKLEHEVSHKIHARAGLMDEDYQSVCKQPTQGAAKGGGQKMGEMELCALAAYGANELLHETCNGLSDNVIARIQSMMQDLHIQGDLTSLIREAGSITQEDASVPHAVEMFRYMLEAAGIDMDSFDSSIMLPSVTTEAARARALPNMQTIFATHAASRQESGVNTGPQLTQTHTQSNPMRQKFGG